MRLFCDFHGKVRAIKREGEVGKPGIHFRRVGLLRKPQDEGANVFLRADFLEEAHDLDKWVCLKRLHRGLRGLELPREGERPPPTYMLRRQLSVIGGEVLRGDPEPTALRTARAHCLRRTGRPIRSARTADRVARHPVNIREMGAGGLILVQESKGDPAG